MKREPLVSIGIPTHNGASRHLKEALDSILSQTYRNLEVIVSDNASTDSTEALCRAFAAKDRRIRYVRQRTNIGAIPNFNFVLGEAKGEYFMWHADDDVRERTCIEKSTATFAKNPDFALVFFGFSRFDAATGRRIIYDPKKCAPLERDLYVRLKHHILLPWSDGKAVPVYGLFNRNKIGSDRLEDYIGLGFDMNFVFRALGRGSFGIVDEVLFMKQADLGHPATFRFGIVHRITYSLFYRLRRIFSPYFISQIGFIFGIKALPFPRRCALAGWVLFAMGRLLVRRKM